MIADSLGVTGSVTAVSDIADLVAGDNPADDRRLPVIIRGDQSPVPSCSSKVGLANALGTPY